MASTGTAPRGQQGKAYGRDRIETLVREALESLMADGTPYRDLSVERITSAAGIARSTFYATFDDKAALISALSAQSLKRLYAGARNWLHRGADASRQDVVVGMREIYATFREDETIMRAVIETSAYEPTVRDAYARGVDDFAGAIARMIRTGESDPRMRTVPAAETASVLAWATEAAIRRAASDQSEATIDALADVVWRTLFVEDGRAVEPN